MGEFWVFGWDWIGIWELGFWGNTSEKGYTRKTTGNRVASWGLMFLGEFKGFALFHEENGFGEVGFWSFLGGLFEVPRGGCEEGGSLCAFEECF
jgi:hypothetical protein